MQEINKDELIDLICVAAEQERTETAEARKGEEPFNVLTHSEIIRFMRNFECDFINHNDEMIIDLDYNIYFCIDICDSVQDLEANTLLALCRPIGKGIEKRKRKWRELLERFNDYFGTQLTREDMCEIYVHLCYSRMGEAVKKFIADGFPMDRIEEYAAMRKQVVP